MALNRFSKWSREKVLRIKKGSTLTNKLDTILNITREKLVPNQPSDLDHPQIIKMPTVQTLADVCMVPVC